MKTLDRLIGALRGCCHALPDLRQGGDVRYTMADIGLSAFSLFFLQSPSFLAHQRRLEAGQGRSNCQTLFGLDRVPSDNHIRALLDPVSPDHFHPVFTEVVAELEGSGGLEPCRLPIKLPRSTGSIATQFQSHLELLHGNSHTENRQKRQERHLVDPLLAQFRHPVADATAGAVQHDPSRHRCAPPRRAQRS
jgi:hypothetical protein